jgi:hypothetical protein
MRTTVCSPPLHSVLIKIGTPADLHKGTQPSYKRKEPISAIVYNEMCHGTAYNLAKTAESSI